MKKDSLAEPGRRIRMIKMVDDPNPVESGLEGTIDHVDSTGTIHVNWDDGRFLGVIPGEDEYQILPKTEDQIDFDVFEEKFTSTLPSNRSTDGAKKVKNTFKKEFAKTNPRITNVKFEGKTEDLTENVFKQLQKKFLKKKEKNTDYLGYVNNLKQITKHIDSSTPKQKDSLLKMVDNFEKKFKDHDMVGEITDELRKEIGEKLGVDEMTTTGSVGGSFVQPIGQPVKRKSLYEPKNENVIKYMDLINEVTSSRNTDRTNSGGGYDGNTWAQNDGWKWNDKPLWTKGEIVDILAKKDINWKDSNLSINEVAGKDIHKKKWKRCVEKVKKNSPEVNPYAVCTDSIGYEGSIKKKHRKKESIEENTKNKKDEEELEETTTFSSVWGVNGPPVTPAFAAKKGKHRPSKKPIWKGGKIVQKINSDDVLTEVNKKKYVEDGKYVKIKDKCAKYNNQPWCSQGALDDPLELSDTTFESIKEVAKKMGISEGEALQKIKAKLKGVSKEQLEYNRKHGLPLDWKGSVEGYIEKMDGVRNYSGSN